MQLVEVEAAALAVMGLPPDPQTGLFRYRRRSPYAILQSPPTAASADDIGRPTRHGRGVAGAETAQKLHRPKIRNPQKRAKYLNLLVPEVGLEPTRF